MRESDIEKKANAYAEKLGYWQRKFTTPGRRSAPDRIYAISGAVFFIEYKATGQKPTPLQASEHEKMRRAGLRVYVCDSVEAAKCLLDSVKKESDL